MANEYAYIERSKEFGLEQWKWRQSYPWIHLRSEGGASPTGRSLQFPPDRFLLRFRDQSHAFLLCLRVLGCCDYGIFIPAFWGNVIRERSTADKLILNRQGKTKFPCALCPEICGKDVIPDREDLSFSERPVHDRAANM